MFTELCSPSLFQLAPHLLAPPNNPTKKKRVGFVSSLIGGDEPHGLLVLDVIRSLTPTGLFEFFVVSAGSKVPSADFFKTTNGNVFTTGFDGKAAEKLLQSLELDCLVYCESMNEATLHFLGHQRYASTQILVMGSPVTSGLVSTMDYFVSGDLLEHPFRTQLKDDHYSEQVVLFDGQAISFPEKQQHPVQSSALAAGDARLLSNYTAFEIMTQLQQQNAHIYLCFQSIYKPQPSFDHVLVDILVADPLSHIILQASRYRKQTATFDARLKSVLKERFCGDDTVECPSMQRAHARILFLPRVKSDQVIPLMQRSSVILHPFPFGGSKTATDAIKSGVPLVTYPQRYLRGRMAAVFFRFMDLHEVDPDVSSCCVASSVSDYVSKALRLASDHWYRSRVSHAIKERRHRVWDDKLVSFEWGKLLTRALGIRISEEELATSMNFQRESYQLESYIARKVEDEQRRWKKRVMLSDIMAAH